MREDRELSPHEQSIKDADLMLKHAAQNLRQARQDIATLQRLADKHSAAVILSDDFATQIANRAIERIRHWTV